MKEQHGKNATHAFEDVGHSVDAREQMKAYEIARLHPVSESTSMIPIDGFPPFLF